MLRHRDLAHARHIFASEFQHAFLQFQNSHETDDGDVDDRQMVCVDVGILMRPSEGPMDGAPPSGVAGNMGDGGKAPERSVKANGTF